MSMDQNTNPVDVEIYWPPTLPTDDEEADDDSPWTIKTE